jgi:hypothetical protein
MTTRPRIAPLAIFLAFAPACGFKQSNAIDLAPVAGMPVELSNVRMAESLYALLPGKTSFSSSDGPNAIGIAYDVNVVAAAPQYAGVSAQLACRVGEHTIVSRLASDASNRLATSAVGTKLEQRDTFPPTPFLDAIPEVCETTIYYAVVPPLTSVPSGPDDPVEPAPTPHALGTVCFADNKVTEGPCSAELLPRVPADSPIAVSRVVGRIGSLQSGGYGVGVSVLATGGEPALDEFRIGAEAQCRVGDAVQKVPLGLMMFGRDLRPGDSFWESAATTPNGALASEPTWCTVEVLLATDGNKELLAEYCVRGEATTDGRCE